MRWPLFIANTPFPPTPTVKLHEETWKNHVLPNHPEMAGKDAQVKHTLEAPLVVCSATAADYYTFVSNSELDSKGKPLIVVVSPNDSSGEAVVATAYYGSKEYLNAAQTKWKKHWP